MHNIFKYISADIDIDTNIVVKTADGQLKFFKLLYGEFSIHRLGNTSSTWNAKF